MMFRYKKGEAGRQCGCLCCVSAGGQEAGQFTAKLGIIELAVIHKLAITVMKEEVRPIGGFIRLGNPL
ncbi:hypothetical protein CQ052_19330 [Ochrobactrum sp. MYb15]|nr:hypothetical protein CQZ90_21215 [Ochrobactrum sp. MYb19]PRA60777.1 hypothetical protein CQ053_21020 [Ochrobactrum sp. MYb18]PRA73514.1 hypothetical protein CQ049_20840 [Brucella thiophenivorans]PRA85102.1 hypothetical protein CQ051_21225 [Ochrobactrum sp. MYb14]PRA94569.1 hypothetical protein CQ052_19330 [Ochrobactrum sp. MYb15]